MNSTRQSPLADAIRDKVNSVSLEHSQLQALRDMQHAMLDQPGASDTGSRKLQPWALSICASVVLIVTMLWLTVLSGGQNPAQAIAAEVATNHLKLKPLDIAGRSIEEMREFFTQLDFSPVNPTSRTMTTGLEEQNLLGGRYCSISGVTAAQLRYQGDGNQLQTLYQVPYDKDLHGAIPSLHANEPPLELQTRGLRVFLWQEKGLLMALVSSI